MIGFLTGKCQLGLHNVMISVSVEGFKGGDTQIENILCHEVEIRKDLLPVYEQLYRIKS